MTHNKTSTKYYALTNDADGTIVLTPTGETAHKPARHRELMTEIGRLESQLAEAVKVIESLVEDEKDWFDSFPESNTAETEHVIGIAETFLATLKGE